MTKIPALRLSLALLLTFSTSSIRAEIDWRLSIKVIADVDDQVDPDYVDRAANEVVRANEFMHRTGRGQGFDLLELIVLKGVSQWHMHNVDENGQASLEEAVRDQPGLFAYRADAINIYVVVNPDRGRDPYPDAPGDIILMSGRMRSGMLLHACGHFFGLRHTHEGQRFQYVDGSYCGGWDACDCPQQFPGDGDATSETAPDNQCYASADVISRAAFNLPFVDLDPARQERVENSRLNFMSYHDNPERLTSDQLDFMTSGSNTQRRYVATGVTWFVSGDGNDGNAGNVSNSRFQTIARALEAATFRDEVLLRAGTFTTPTTLQQPITLRASRGDAHLVRP